MKRFHFWLQEKRTGDFDMISEVAEDEGTARAQALNHLAGTGCVLRDLQGVEDYPATHRAAAPEIRRDVP